MKFPINMARRISIEWDVVERGISPKEKILVEKQKETKKEV